MKKSKVFRDSESFYVDTHTGRLRSDEVGTIEALASEIEQNKACSPIEFGYDFPILADIAILDAPRKTAITRLRLIHSYSGW